MDKPKQKRGFAGMSREKRLSIASTGGIAAHAQGRAHQWNSETARAAGKLGRGSAKRSRQKIKAELE